MVIGLDKAHQTFNKFVRRFEYPAADDLARENTEPDFDLVEPEVLLAAALKPRSILRSPDRCLLSVDKVAGSVAL